jgi:hypothetical protein
MCSPDGKNNSRNGMQQSIWPWCCEIHHTGDLLKGVLSIFFVYTNEPFW